MISNTRFNVTNLANFGKCSDSIHKNARFINSVLRKCKLIVGQPKGVFTQHCFQLKMENFVCILAVHLHDNTALGAWKCKLLKIDFKVLVFENNIVIVSE